VFRGVPPTGGSAFTKDTVYLRGLISVHTFFRWAMSHGKLLLCRRLFAGKMTLGDVQRLEPLFDRACWCRRAGCRNGSCGPTAWPGCSPSRCSPTASASMRWRKGCDFLRPI
jgi:hypothetical protein